MGNFIDIKGQIFNGVISVSFEKDESTGKNKWLCKCHCSNFFYTSGYALRSGHTKSCGCSTRAVHDGTGKKHGMWKSPEYLTWRRIKTRCLNTKDKKYPNYGGRGIKICDEWKDDFMQFYKDTGKHPGKGCSIERIDVNGDYEPSNVVYIKDSEQAKNRTTSRKLTAFGKTMILEDWKRELGITGISVHYWLKKMSFEQFIINKFPSYHKYKPCNPCVFQFNTTQYVRLNA